MKALKRDWEGEKVIVWLEYFNAPSRSKGRRFPKLKRTVTLDDVVKAAKSLNLDPEPLANIRYPRTKREGAVLVKKLGSKQKTLKALYQALLKTI